LQIGIIEATASVQSKISGRRSHPHHHFSCQKARWICLLYDIRISAVVSLILSQFMHLTDGWSVWVSSFLTAHQHMLGYLVPYHGVVDLDKRVRL